EERLILYSMIGLTVVALVCARWVGTRPAHPTIAAVALLGGVIGLVTNGAKLSFDSIVQRDAPDAARGRTFARFETRFQLMWVVGAVLPVVIPIPRRLGIAMIAAGAAFAAFSYVGGLRTVRR